MQDDSLNVSNHQTKYSIIESDAHDHAQNHEQVHDRVYVVGKRSISACQSKDGLNNPQSNASHSAASCSSNNCPANTVFISTITKKSSVSGAHHKVPGHIIGKDSTLGKSEVQAIDSAFAVAVAPSKAKSVKASSHDQDYSNSSASFANANNAVNANNNSVNNANSSKAKAHVKRTGIKDHSSSMGSCSRAAQSASAKAEVSSVGSCRRTRTKALGKIKRSWKEQIIHTLALFLPLLMGQLAATSMGVVDTVMAGAAGTLELSGVAIGSSIFWPSELMVVGMALAIHPLIANLVGSGELEKVPLRMQIATVCCVSCAMVIGIVIMFVPEVYNLFDSVDKDMVSIGQGYLIAVGLAMPGFAMFNVLRAYWEGLGKTLPTLFFGCTALLLNIPLNYIFIFGKFGMPQLGGIGCGVATAITIYLTVVCMLIYIRKAEAFANVRIYTKWLPMTWTQISSFMKLSLPLGVAGMIETLCFSLVAIMLSPFGPVVVASHTIAMNVSGLLAIVPIALSATASIDVGEAMGTKSWDNAKQRAISSTSIALAFYVVGATILFTCAEAIAGLYSNDLEVLLLAPVLMMYCCVFFLPETLQVMSVGILRGFKDSKTIFIVTIVAYWVIGMPIGYALGYGHLGEGLLGAEGFWLGFIISLTAASVLLVGRLIYIFAKRIDIGTALNTAVNATAQVAKAASTKVAQAKDVAVKAASATKAATDSLAVEAALTAAVTAHEVTTQLKASSLAKSDLSEDGDKTKSNGTQSAEPSVYQNQDCPSANTANLTPSININPKQGNAQSSSQIQSIYEESQELAAIAPIVARAQAKDAL